MTAPRHWWQPSTWDRHPLVPSGEELTRGERAADVVRNGMGSWGFVLAAALFLGAWMAVNRSHGFDPYPFILLNLVLSCVAAMQGAILLIAAKREDQINAALATHDYETNTETDHVVHDLLARVTELQAEVKRLADVVTGPSDR
jgi:uncharacterized membrane protein